MIHVLVLMSSHWYYLPRVDLQPRSQARTTRTSGPPPEVLNGGMPRATRRASTRVAKSNGSGYDEDTALAEALSLSLSQENDRERREPPQPKKKSRLKLQKPPAAAQAPRPYAVEPAPAAASKKRALPDGVGASSSCHATRSVHCQLPYFKVRLATGGGRGAAAAADRSGGSSVTILHRQGCTDRTSE